jgi:hypothetical protein
MAWRGTFVAKREVKPRGTVCPGPEILRGRLRGAGRVAETLSGEDMWLQFISHDSTMVISMSMLFIGYSNGCGNYFEWGWGGCEAGGRTAPRRPKAIAVPEDLRPCHNSRCF